MKKSGTTKTLTLCIFFSAAVLAAVSGCKNSLVGLGGRVDLTPPEGSVTGISNGDYVSGIITLEGTIEDDKEVDTVWALIEGEIVSGVIDTDGTWDIVVDTDDPLYGGDGDKDITIYLRDADGKITEKQMLLYFDNTPPVLMVTSPELSNPQGVETFTIRGEAYDPLRLASVTAAVGGPSDPSISDENQGTSDSWSFDVTNSTSGTYDITITAEDMAGNTSIAVYHATDLRYVNGSSSITIIDLYNLSIWEPGDDVDLIDHLTITPADLNNPDLGYDLPSGSRRLSLLDSNDNPGAVSVDVDRTLDNPQVTVNNPNPNTAAPGDTLGPSSKINGTVTDNVSVNPDSIEIRFLDTVGDPLTGADTALSSWTAVTGYQYINDKNYNFSHDLPTFHADTNYTFEIRAADENSPTPNWNTPETIPFVYDSNAPVVEVTAPALGSYVPDSTVMIEGIVNDTEPISVEISLDGGAFEEVGTFPGTGSDENWNYPLADYEALYGAIGDFETVNVSVRATAGSSTTRTNHSFIMDRLSPEVEFLTPEDGIDVNGVVTLRVAVSDSSLDTVSYEIGNPGDGQVYGVDESDIYNFSHSIITTEFEYGPIATESPAGSDIWELPVTVTAEDKAGHVTVTSGYSMFIDNARDRPEVSIIYPAEGESYGGEVTVSGIATDDDGVVGAVYAQVDLDTLPGDDPDFSGFHNLTDGIVFDGSTTVYNVDETAAYEVFGLSSWSFSLNSTGELYDMGGGHNGDIYVRVWAEDPNNALVISEPELLHFRLDDTLPRIENVRIDDEEVAANDYVSGTVVLAADVSDNSRIDKVEMSYNNGVSWETLSIIPGASITPEVSIDTAARVTGGNGILYLRMKATDDTGFTTQEVLPLNVDNDAPAGAYTGETVLNGADATLQGTATDPVGSIAGVERIEVYLEREGLVYDPAAAYPYTNPATPDIATEEITFGAGNYYPADDDANPDTPLPGLMIIDDIYEGGSDSPGGDGDGYDESLTLSASTWNWWVNFDSGNIPDGNITIHYVVVDEAGNMTHSTQSARIENNPPSIQSVVLGTDVNYSAAVDTTVGNGEAFRFIDGTGTDGSGLYYRNFDSAVTGITTRNGRLYIDADEAVGEGNGSPAAWNWELLYEGAGDNFLGAGVDSVEITDFTGMNEDVSVTFLLRVTDDAGLSDEVELNLILDNDDDVDPTVILNPLDLTSRAVISARGGAGNYGYPIPGYDPSETPLWGSAEGRLRPAGTDEYDGDDADVSGTVIVSGVVSDDKALHELELTIDGYNGGLGTGNPFVILEWDAAANGGLGGLSAATGINGNAHLAGESYGESSGHAVSWSFEFDTADISGGAGDDIRVTATAMDKSGNTNTPVNDTTSDNYTMDVMPFVSGIVVSDAAYASSSGILRSRFGAWPVREDSYLKISGFNLGSTLGMVETAAGGGPDLGGSFEPFTVSSVSTDRTEIRARAEGVVASGWLTAETNGIPLMNYYGDFDENDSGSDDWSADGQWTDDRYLLVWDVAEEMAGSDDAVWGAMDVNPVDGSLWGSWSEYSSARVYVSNESAQYNDDIADAGIFRIYDPSEYTDISLNDNGSPYVVHLANFYGGSGDWDNGSGGLVLWGENADRWGYWDNGTQNPYGNTVYGIRAEEIERFYEDERLWQFQNPRVCTTGTDGDTDIHVSYYDNYSKALKYAHFYDNGTIYNTTFETTLNGDAGSGTNNQEYLRDNMGYADQNIIAGTASSADGSDMGIYSDITVDAGGRPVVVYYDTGNSTLRLTRATTVDPTDHSPSGGDWVDQAVLANSSYVGKYPSVRIDPNGRIHITAYKISTGDLMYFSAPNPGVGNPYDFSGTGSIADTVDSDGNMGAFADMDLYHDPVDNVYGNGDDVYRPVIGYLNSSNVGTFQGLKFAYLQNDGEWEHGTVPLLNTINDERISTVGKPGNLAAENYSMAIGYHSSSYRYAWLRLE